MARPKQSQAGIVNHNGFLRVADAARLLNYKSEKAIRRAVKLGLIPHYRFGRDIFLREDELIASMRRVSSRTEILG